MLSSFGSSRALVAIIFIWIASSTVQADAIITTIPEWNKSSAVSAFGYGATATYGETITAPADNVLTSFSFEMKLPTDTTFRGYVYGWSGTMATGPELFASASAKTAGAGSFQEITFDTGGIALTPGASYVLFASTTGLDGAGQGIWGETQGKDTYTGGEFVFINNANTDELTKSQWTTGHLGRGADLAFEATFASRSSSVPEPASLALVGVAMAGVIALRRRRK
jgi:hypothetical protein